MTEETDKITEQQAALAANLVRFRKAAGLTQLELAEKLMYSNKTISKWERGESVPDIFTLKSIAEIYGVTVNDILGGVVPEPPEEERAEADPKYKFKRAMLIMSCALLGCVTLMAFLLMLFLVGSGKDEAGRVMISAVSATGYGYWVFFIYNIPLDALAVFVFELVVHRRARQWCISAMLWGVIASIHLSIMQLQPLTALMYIAGVPFQILISTFCRYLNLMLRAKK